MVTLVNYKRSAYLMLQCYGRCKFAFTANMVTGEFTVQHLALLLINSDIKLRQCLKINHGNILGDNVKLQTSQANASSQVLYVSHYFSVSNNVKIKLVFFQLAYHKGRHKTCYST